MVCANPAIAENNSEHFRLLWSILHVSYISEPTFFKYFTYAKK